MDDKSSTKSNTQSSTVACANCGSLQLSWKKKAKKWECLDCETRFDGEPPVELQSHTCVSFNNLFNTMPSMVAIPLQAYYIENHPVMRLHRMCDALDLLTRFISIAEIGHFRSETGEVKFPNSVEVFLRTTIRRPTLGIWAQTLKILTAELESKQQVKNHLTLSLINFAKANLLPALLGTSGKKQERRSSTAVGEKFSSLIELRNALVHGGAMTGRAAMNQLSIWEPIFFSLCSACCFLASTDLVYVNGDASLKLFGVGNAIVYRPLPEIFDRMRHLDGRVVLIQGEVIINLWPLCGYDTARSPDSFDKIEGQNYRPTVYYRAEAERLLHSVLGGERPITELRNPVADFKRMFHLDEEIQSQQLTSRDFEAEIVSEAASLIGRVTEIFQAKKIIKESERGVFWLYGPGGIGKSYFAAKLAVAFKGDPRKILCIFWRFRTNDPRCSTEAFLIHAITQISHWLRQPQAIKANSSRTELEDRLRELLGFSAQSSGAPNEKRVRRILFIIDGIDEIVRMDSAFSKLPFMMDFPKVIWLCVGRAEGELVELFSHYIFTPLFQNGLPPLGNDDIRAMLLEQPGEMKYGLLQRDIEEQADIGLAFVRNPFVDTVVSNARGLPLYLRFVIEDLLSGEYGVRDENRLPKGLSEYYQRILHRLSVGDLQSILTPLVMIFAMAGSPLDGQCIYELLVISRRLCSGLNGKELIDRALQHVQSLLRRAPTPWGTDGYSLCHDTLREHLLQAPEVKNERDLILQSLCEMTEDYEKIPEGIGRDYVMRFGPMHLAQANSWKSLLKVIETPEFMEGFSLFLSNQLISGEKASEQLTPLLAQALENRNRNIVAPMLKEIEWAAHRGYYENIERYFSTLSELCSFNPEMHTVHLVLIKYLQAWLEREKGHLKLSAELFEKIDPERAGEYRERIMYQKANVIRESGQYATARSIYQLLYDEAQRQNFKNGEQILFTQQYADIEYVQGQHLLATNILRTTQDVCSQDSHPMEMAEVLRIQGHIYRMNERYGDALSSYEQAVDLFKRAYSIFGIARVETNFAETMALMDPKAAIQYGQRAVELNSNLNTQIEVGKAHNAIGLALLALGKPDQAKQSFEGAANIQREVGYRAGVGMVLLNVLTYQLFNNAPADQIRQTFFEMYELFQSIQAYPLLIYKGALLVSEWGLADDLIKEIREVFSTKIQWLEDRSEFDRLAIEHYRIKEGIRV